MQLVQGDDINGADQAADAYRVAAEGAAGEAAEPGKGEKEREQQEEEEQNACEDNDKLLTKTFVPGIGSGTACAEALSYVRCGFKTEAGLLSELCPLSCDSCQGQQPSHDHGQHVEGVNTDEVGVTNDKCAAGCYVCQAGSSTDGGIKLYAAAPRFS
jgi:hypothetical protein